MVRIMDENQELKSAIEVNFIYIFCCYFARWESSDMQLKDFETILEGDILSLGFCLTMTETNNFIQFVFPLILDEIRDDAFISEMVY